MCCEPGNLPNNVSGKPHTTRFLRSQLNSIKTECKSFNNAVQRGISRRNKGSERRENAKLKLKRKREHAANQSDDFVHKLSAKLANSGYVSFEIEGLHIQNMAKDHRLAQSIQDATPLVFHCLLPFINWNLL